VEALSAVGDVLPLGAGWLSFAGVAASAGGVSATTNGVVAVGLVTAGALSEGTEVPLTASVVEAVAADEVAAVLVADVLVPRTVPSLPHVPQSVPGVDVEPVEVAGSVESPLLPKIVLSCELLRQTSSAQSRCPRTVPATISVSPFCASPSQAIRLFLNTPLIVAISCTARTMSGVTRP